MADTKELTNVLLKTIMTDALVLRSCSDFDTFLQPGHTTVTEENTKNHPDGAYRYGVVACFGTSKSFMAQIYFPHQKGKIYWRVYYCPYASTTGTWSAWNVVESQILT